MRGPGNVRGPPLTFPWTDRAAEARDALRVLDQAFWQISTAVGNMSRKRGKCTVSYFFLRFYTVFRAIAKLGAV